MEGLRNYVSSIKLPNYQELKNGEFFKKMFEAENPTKENSYLVNFEVGFDYFLTKNIERMIPII